MTQEQMAENTNEQMTESATPEIRYHSRIRALRRSRGLRLREVAAALDSTPQTISRLETGYIALSIEWLDKLADYFDVHPMDLLEERFNKQSGDSLELLGNSDMQGMISLQASMIPFRPAARQPVAVRAEQACGSFQNGDILIGDKSGILTDNVLQYAIICTKMDEVRLVQALQNGRNVTFLTIDNQHLDLQLVDLQWLAPVVMSYKLLA